MVFLKAYHAALAYQHSAKVGTNFPSSLGAMQRRWRVYPLLGAGLVAGVVLVMSLLIERSEEQREIDRLLPVTSRRRPVNCVLALSMISTRRCI